MTALIRLALALGALTSAMNGSGSCTTTTYGSLWIRIESPTSSESFVTDQPATHLGGMVGGWSVLDPAPTVDWVNERTGVHGSTGQLVGTFSVGPIPLLPGANPLVVRARNGKQHSDTDSIVVTYTP